MFKYRVISGSYFSLFGLNTEIYGINSVFSPNTGKYGLEKTQYLVFSLRLLLQESSRSLKKLEEAWRSSFNRNVLLKGISYSWLIFFLAQLYQGSQFYGFSTPFSLFQTFRQSLSLVNLKINYCLVIFASLVACLLFQAMLTPVHFCPVGPSLVMLYRLKNRLQYNCSYNRFYCKNLHSVPTLHK